MEITEIGVSVKRELDVGYAPYMEFIRQCALERKPVPFGTREQSRQEITAWGKATLKEGEDASGAIQSLIQMLDGQVLQALRTLHPECFEGLPESTETLADEFAYQEVKAVINPPEGGPEEW